MLLGYGTKMGLAPLHTWLPDAHSEAPSPVSALLSGALLNCAFLAILRVQRLCGGGHGLLQRRPADPVRPAVDGAGRGVHPPTKRLQTHAGVLQRRAHGHSGAGCRPGRAGAFGAFLHAVNHSVVKAMLFFTAGNILSRFHTKDTTKIQGACDALPISGALWIAGFLAVTGSPPFGTFISEFTILRATLDQGRWVIAVLYVLFLLLAFAGMSGIVLRMALGKSEVNRVRELVTAVLPPIVLAVLALLLGVYLPGPLADRLHEAAQLLGGMATITLPQLHNGQALPLKDIPELAMPDFHGLILERVRRGKRISSLFGMPDGDQIMNLAVLAHDSQGMPELCRTRVRDRYPALTPESPRPTGSSAKSPSSGAWSRRDTRGLSPSASTPPCPQRDAWRRIHPSSRASPTSSAWKATRSTRLRSDPCTPASSSPATSASNARRKRLAPGDCSGYQHRGIERSLIGGPGPRAFHYMETLAGDTTVGHATAYASIQEALGAVTPRPGLRRCAPSRSNWSGWPTTSAIWARWPATWAICPPPPSAGACVATFSTSPPCCAAIGSAAASFVPAACGSIRRRQPRTTF